MGVQGFLQDCSDERLHVDNFTEVARQWLEAHHNRHPSLWDKEVFQARDRLVHMAICRRAARAEAWVLTNLNASNSGTNTAQSHDKAWGEL